MPTSEEGHDREDLLRRTAGMFVGRDDPDGGRRYLEDHSPSPMPQQEKRGLGAVGWGRLLVILFVIGGAFLGNIGRWIDDATSDFAEESPTQPAPSTPTTPPGTAAPAKGLDEVRRATTAWRPLNGGTLVQAQARAGYRVSSAQMSGGKALVTSIGGTGADTDVISCWLFESTDAAAESPLSQPTRGGAFVMHQNVACQQFGSDSADAGAQRRFDQLGRELRALA